MHPKGEKKHLTTIYSADKVSIDIHSMGLAERLKWYRNLAQKCKALSSNIITVSPQHHQKKRYTK
jgi:hypothetical protein